jgi:hypothetical protein
METGCGSPPGSGGAVELILLGIPSRIFRGPHYLVYDLGLSQMTDVTLQIPTLRVSLSSVKPNSKH